MRKRITTLPISLGLFLVLSIAVGAFAQASAPQNSNERDAQPQATAPSQSTTPSQTAPESPGAPASAPQTNAPPSGNQAAPQGGGNGVDIDKELGLTDDQKQKIAAIVDDENRQIVAVRDDTTMSLDQKQQKVLEIRQAGTPRIKAILTPEQLQKLAALQQRMRDQQNGNPGGTQSAPQNPPQH